MPLYTTVSKNKVLVNFGGEFEGNVSLLVPVYLCPTAKTCHPCRVSKHAVGLKMVLLRLCD